MLMLRAAGARLRQPDLRGTAFAVESILCRHTPRQYVNSRPRTLPRAGSASLLSTTTRCDLPRRIDTCRFPLPLPSAAASAAAPWLAAAVRATASSPFLLAVFKRLATGLSVRRSYASSRSPGGSDHSDNNNNSSSSSNNSNGNNNNDNAKKSGGPSKLPPSPAVNGRKPKAGVNAAKPPSRPKETAAADNEQRSRASGPGVGVPRLGRAPPLNPPPPPGTSPARAGSTADTKRQKQSPPPVLPPSQPPSPHHQAPQQHRSRPSAAGSLHPAQPPRTQGRAASSSSSSAGPDGGSRAAADRLSLPDADASVARSASAAAVSANPIERPGQQQQQQPPVQNEVPAVFSLADPVDAPPTAVRHEAPPRPDADESTRAIPRIFVVSDPDDVNYKDVQESPVDSAAAVERNAARLAPAEPAAVHPGPERSAEAEPALPPRSSAGALRSATLNSFAEGSGVAPRNAPAGASPAASPPVPPSAPTDATGGRTTDEADAPLSSPPPFVPPAAVPGSAVPGMAAPTETVVQTVTADLQAAVPPAAVPPLPPIQPSTKIATSYEPPFAATAGQVTQVPMDFVPPAPASSQQYATLLGSATGPAVPTFTTAPNFPPPAPLPEPEEPLPPPAATPPLFTTAPNFPQAQAAARPDTTPTTPTPEPAAPHPLPSTAMLAAAPAATPAQAFAAQVAAATAATPSGTAAPSQPATAAATAEPAPSAAPAPASAVHEQVHPAAATAPAPQQQPLHAVPSEPSFWQRLWRRLRDKLLALLRRLWKATFARFWKYFKESGYTHLGYVISTCALLVTDILWLRSLMICSSLCGMYVNLKFFKPPFWIGLYWGAFFISINLIQIGRILFDRRGVRFSPEEQRVYDDVFAPVFTPLDFRRLVQAGHFQQLEPGHTLVEQGRAVTKVYLLTSGLCVCEEEVELDNAVADAAAGVTGSKPIVRLLSRKRETVADLKAGSMVGELSIVSGASEIAPFTVTVVEPTHVVVWEAADLRAVFFKYPSLSLGWNTIVSADIVKRLKEQRKTSRSTQYRLLLYGIMSDGHVGREERMAADLYRKQNRISQEEHQRALEELGWTMEDWSRGSKRKGLLDYTQELGTQMLQLLGAPAGAVDSNGKHEAPVAKALETAIDQPY